MKSWAESNKITSGGTLGEWIFNRGSQNQNIHVAEKDEEEFEPSLTLNAVQENWQTPSKFPCCPQEAINNSIHSYFANLEIGKVFAENQYLSSIIIDFAISQEKNTLWVMCKNSKVHAIKPYTLAEVSYKKKLFVHTALGSFFNKEGADKKFTLSQGFEWTGEDTFDDFT